MNTLSFAAEAVLAESLRTSFVVIGFIAVRRFLSGRVPPAYVHAGWVVIGVVLLMPISLRVAWAPFGWAEQISHDYLNQGPAFGETAGTNNPPPEGGRTHQERLQRPVLANGSSAPEAAGPRAPVMNAPVRASSINMFASLWLSGMIVLLVVRVCSHVVFWKRVRRTAEPLAPRLGRIVVSVTQQVTPGKSIHCVATRAVCAPAVAGLFRPTLLFPPSFLHDVSQAELRWVILHELGHLRRRDLWSQAVMDCARIVHWFNPLVWLAAKLARFDCELACDESVIRRAGPEAPAAYGGTLLKVLAMPHGNERMPGAVGILESKEQLKKRIHMIAQFQSVTPGRVIAGTLLVFSVAMMSLTRADEVSTTGTSTENKITTDAPKGWHKNGDRPESYEVGLDPTQSHRAPVSAYIASNAPKIEGFGGMMQTFKADAFKGKRVQFSAWIKTVDIAESANLWLRVDGPAGRPIRFDNIQSRAPRGTTDWKQFSAVLDVPAEATNIAMGFFVKGTGKAWFNDPQFTEVDSSVPETDMKKKAGMPDAPQNLTFSSD